jgi:hypothetical protein
VKSVWLHVFFCVVDYYFYFFIFFVKLPNDMNSQVESNVTWYDVRDTLTGQNYVEQNVKRALEQAASCSDPQAKWLTATFANRNVESVEDAKQVFLEQGDGDAGERCMFILCVCVF